LLNNLLTNAVEAPKGRPMADRSRRTHRARRI
jgi:hypothetical protein